MTFRIYSPIHLAGVPKDDLWGLFDVDDLETLTVDGVLRVTCPCCTKPVVVRWGDEPLTAEDLGYLGVKPS